MRFDDGDPYEREREYRGPERREAANVRDVAPVRLIRKYAKAINGIDLSAHDVGDRLALSPRDAYVLIAEGWAEPVAAEERRR